MENNKSDEIQDEEHRLKKKIDALERQLMISDIFLIVFALIVLWHLIQARNFENWTIECFWDIIRIFGHINIL